MDTNIFTCYNCAYHSLSSIGCVCIKSDIENKIDNCDFDSCDYFNMDYIKIIHILQKRYVDILEFEEICDTNKFANWRKDNNNANGLYSLSSCKIVYGNILIFRNAMTALHEIGHHEDLYISENQPEYCEEKKAEFWKHKILNEYRFSRNIIDREMEFTINYLKKWKSSKSCIGCNKCNYLGEYKGLKREGV